MLTRLECLHLEDGEDFDAGELDCGGAAQLGTFGRTVLVGTTVDMPERIDYVPTSG